jgi:quinoprotein glucose dehydrogenase
MVGTKPHTLAALTQGGDVARGRKLFAERADWACQRCHKLNGEGGDVGPDLTGIGKRMTRAQIFEAILNPNGSIAAGYETVILSLKDGDSKVGIIVSEANGVLTLNSPEDGRIEIPIANIRSRERAPSAMPEGLTEMITRGEMRDLIEALARP